MSAPGGTGEGKGTGGRERRRGRRLGRFARARGGVSAVEFALIAPILLFAFMAAVELPRAYSTGRRLAQAATTMADLISRDDFGTLDDVYASAQVVANPHDTSAAGIVLTAGGVYKLGTDGVLVARVCSSAQRNDTARATGSALGAGSLRGIVDGDRFVMAEIRMRYAALFPVFPVLGNWTFRYAKIWPVRAGRTVWGQPEVVLPGGQPCPP